MYERNKEIGQNIKKYRRKRSMSQQKLANIIGKTESSIRKYEKGLVTIPLNVLEKIASALNTYPYELIGPEYYDKKYPADLAENLRSLKAITYYLEEMGYNLNYIITKWHYKDDIDDSGKVICRSKVEDEGFHVLTKNNLSIYLTDEEFNELQVRIKETVEGIFSKKVLQDIQNNNK